jgi:hypothetical protein
MTLVTLAFADYERSEVGGELTIKVPHRLYCKKSSCDPVARALVVTLLDLLIRYLRFSH